MIYPTVTCPRCGKVNRDAGHLTKICRIEMWSPEVFHQYRTPHDLFDATTYVPGVGRLSGCGFTWTIRSRRMIGETIRSAVS